MKFEEFVGIDVGKKELEVWLHLRKLSRSFVNTPSGIKSLVNWIEGDQQLKRSVVHYCFEHTGLYSYPLAVSLTENGSPFSMVPGMEIKRSLGITRGKSDKIDARRIAQYAYRRRDELIFFKLENQEIQELKKLLSLRDKLVTQRGGYEASLGEYKLFLDRKHNPLLFTVQEKMIKELKTQIKKIEEQLDHLITSTEALKTQYDLLTDIKGVGPQTALYMIAYTNGFTKFKAWRQFASYCGTAPFPNSSGTSLRGKTKVSSLANKKIKSLLNMCAQSAIVHNTEMKSYYERKTAEGKAKMSVINAVRNKLLARMFAVINRGTEYVDIMAYAS